MDPVQFGLAVFALAGLGLAAILIGRVSERLQLPAPLFFLLTAAVGVRIVDDSADYDPHVIEAVVSLALVVILFNGGLHIGWRRFRAVAGPVAMLGVVGTFLTTAGVAVFAHWALGLDWYVALLLGAAVAPTDPAVVFAVLGRREIAGPAGTVLEGESGANDPVGIALMAALIAAGEVSGGAMLDVFAEFGLQMVVGLAVGVLGWRALRWFAQVRLPNEGLYPLRLLAGAFTIFGAANAAHGSGFLAVFVAGILLGDERAPYKRETVRFLTALASLGEIVAFVALGLTVDLEVVRRTDVWGPGLVLGLVLATVIRPGLVGICMRPLRLSRRDQGFVLWAGLKGAVPILLGSLALEADIADPERLYGIVVVVVVFSVAVQGSTVSLVARLLRIPMRNVALAPYSLDLRLRVPPECVHRVRLVDGSVADGALVAELPEVGERYWVSAVIRDGAVLPLRRTTRLAPGDHVVLLTDPDAEAAVGLFTRPGPWTVEP